MVLTRRTHKLLNAPRLPTELLAEITRLAPESSYWALCRTNRTFHDLANASLYRDIVISCTGNTVRETQQRIRRTEGWCRTVTDNGEKAALVKSVTITDLPQ